MRIRQFISIARENLDAVISPWIVRSRDNDPGSILSRTREIRHARRRNDARTMNFTSARNQSHRYAVGDPTTRFPGVLANHHPRIRITANQIMTQGAANEICTLRRQREFTGYAANAVGSKELSCLGCHCGFADWSLAVPVAFCMITVTRTGSGLATWMRASET